jgi:hypothetical protein
VVTYTGTGANATVGHGLGVAPSLVIIKIRSAIGNWPVYHSSIGNTAAILLNQTAAIDTSSLYWNNTTPTSSVFSLGASGTVNTSSGTYVAYCWTPIAGFSAFGSYTGNGSTDGTFIYLGFEPKFILLKRTSSTSDWIIRDSSRSPYNATNADLYPDLSNAEASPAGAPLDFLSNGFKLRSAGYNGSGETWIYAVFASNPFKNSLAF